MPGISISIPVPKPGALIAQGKRAHLALQKANQQAVDQATRKAHRRIQAEIRGAGLGNLSKGVGVSTTLARGSNNPDHALGVIYAKGESRKGRTAEALNIYSTGGPIDPVKGDWLWIATPALKRVVGFGRNRARMTPALFIQLGYEQRFGRLHFKRLGSSRAVLFVTGADISRKSGLALTKSKRASKSRVKPRFVAMFFGLSHTARDQRFDQRKAAAFYASRVPQYIDAILRGATI